MKINKILSLIALMAVAISCSKDDEPEPQIEDVTLSFSETQEILVVPDRLMQSSDPNAQFAAELVSMANQASLSVAMFEAPAGATRSTELITPVNGRTSANKGVVYTWTDAQYGSVAYQIKDVSDRYTFELFYKGTQDTGWYRFLYAEEMKDRSEGYMVMYDPWSTDANNRGIELVRWSWTRKGDIFTMKMTENTSGSSFTVILNTKTKAGSIEYFEGGVKASEITWDAQGSGTWKHFDGSGAVVEEGAWT